MDDPLMNENAGQPGGGAVAEAAAGAAEAGAEEDPIFSDLETLENLTLEELHSAVEARPDVVRATDAANGWTLLHHAVHQGWSPGKIEYLLAAGPDAARTRARNGGPLPIHLVNARTDPEVPILLARTWPEAQHLSYEPREQGNVPFFCAIQNGAPLSVVVAMFLLRYEPAFAAASADRALEVAEKVGENELFEAMDALMLGEHREFDRDATAQDGVMALRLAVQVDADIRVVRFLAPLWPASIRSRDENGRTFLHLAVLNGVSPAMVAYLESLWGGAVFEQDSHGCFPIHYFRSFTNAAELLVTVWPESLQHANDAGEIPLHWAAESNSLPLVQYYVETYPDGVRRRSKNKLLPIHKAVQAAQPVGEQVVPFLIQQWLGSVREKAKDGCTVLHLAVTGRGGPALVDLLVAHEPSLLGARANYRVLALHDAASYSQDLATVRRLIELMGPEAIRETANNGLTPLHLVARHREVALAVALARILVGLAPDLLNAPTIVGWLALHYAAWEGPLSLVQFLAGTRPELLRSVTHHGYTPLHCASFSQPPEVVHDLADRWPGALLTASTEGLPLHCAARSQSSLPSVQALVEREPRALLLPAADGLRRLPLHLAVAREAPRLDIVQYLAEESPGSLRVRDAHLGRSLGAGGWPKRASGRDFCPLSEVARVPAAPPRCSRHGTSGRRGVSGQSLSAPTPTRRHPAGAIFD